METERVARKGLTFQKIASIFAVAVIVLALVASVVFFVWSHFTYEPSSKLYSHVSEKNIVQRDDYVAFLPDGDAKAGIIFYPGAKVEAMSYGYYAQELAKKGYLVTIAKFPLHISFLGTNIASDIQADYSDVGTWFIGGHSLGGVSAAKYTYNHQKDLSGLFLFASYPMNKNDFSRVDLPVLSVFAEKDGVINRSKWKHGKSLLPADTEYQTIKGGNHGQFGWYGEQKGDRKAIISTKQQQDELVRLTDSWVKTVGSK
ncbi:alpha/beta hydrolase [Priestia koreensis]|uniref:alpha/beta hydrolase n=1 Tax=Priestia koreensis TaxID=284581 RepID=UPI001F58B645|nr:alpha/beta hydrolase [Priestia koreensis]MCM3003462.1 alpha/beta hydrolase [Priestia koreensis]UNL86252.1 alpha/beta hydrolase [Priestia koreensis]